MIGFFSRIGRGSLFARASGSRDASGERLLLRFGEAIEESLQVGLREARSSPARSATRVPKPFSAIVTSTLRRGDQLASSGSDFISVRETSIMRAASTTTRRSSHLDA